MGSSPTAAPHVLACAYRSQHMCFHGQVYSAPSGRFASELAVYPSVMLVRTPTSVCCSTCARDGTLVRELRAVFDLDGGPLRRVQLPLQGPEVHGEVFDTQRRYYLTRYPKTPELLELLDGFRSVRRASAIGGILSAGDGNLWVRRWRSRTPTAPDYFDVINAEGTWVSTVAIPAEYGRLAAISASRAICVWLDDYDVPHVRVYSLVKEPRD